MAEVDWQLVDASVDESVQSVTTGIMVAYIVVPIFGLACVIGSIVLCVFYCGCNGNKPRSTCPCAGGAGEDEEVGKGLVPPDESANGGGQINAIRVDNFFQNAWKENVWI
jgi:hypothetical protein